MFRSQINILCKLSVILFTLIIFSECSKNNISHPKLSRNSIIIVPDIQNYTQTNSSPELDAIVDFINYNKSNIAICIQTGDLTNNNTPEQWNNVLENYINKLHPSIQHCECLGNHDYGQNGLANERTTNIPWVLSGDTEILYGNYNENYVRFFKIGNKKFGVLVLEFAVRNNTIDWAHEVLSQHKDTHFILLTHAFLNSDGDLYSNPTLKTDLDHPNIYGLAFNIKINNSVQIYNKLCKQHSNIKYIICGHSLPKEGYVIKTISNTNKYNVKVLLVNFQHFINGGDGNIAIINSGHKESLFHIYSTNKKIFTETIIF